ncbi:MAG: DUF4440 domain-containing protein [Phaeodactylibacter sp.]|nr:DUF4440 domain-containing protein [Phaeodactylibacter sp.]
MKMTTSLLLTALALAWSCRPAPSQNKTEAAEEIRQAEAAFAAMAETQGVPAAFLAFAADSAVLNRNNRLIKGKAAIRAYFGQSSLREVSLKWAPAFVEAAASGDMGYTYGPYQFSAVDTAGQKIEAEGVFHTVWQKQADGTWKYVYD